MNQMTPLNRGSKASLSPSPTMLKANTTSINARPGAKERMGSTNRYSRASLTMLSLRCRRGKFH